MLGLGRVHTLCAVPSSTVVCSASWFGEVTRNSVANFVTRAGETSDRCAQMPNRERVLGILSLVGVHNSLALFLVGGNAKDRTELLLKIGCRAHQLAHEVRALCYC